VGLAAVETRARSRWGLLTSMPAQSMVFLLWVEGGGHPTPWAVHVDAVLDDRDTVRRRGRGGRLPIKMAGVEARV
jgi:hypothetical protein